jgi:signal peptidase I
MDGDRLRGGAFDGDESDTQTYHGLGSDAFGPEEHQPGARAGGWPDPSAHDPDGWTGSGPAPVRRTPGAHFRPEDVPGPPPGYRLASPEAAGWSEGSTWSAFGTRPPSGDVNGHEHGPNGGHAEPRHQTGPRHQADARAQAAAPRDLAEPRHQAPPPVWSGRPDLDGPPPGVAPFAHSTSAGSPYHAPTSPFDPRVRAPEEHWYVNRPDRPGSLRSAVRQGPPREQIRPPRRAGLAARAGGLATRAGELARARAGPRGTRRAGRGYGVVVPPGPGGGGAADVDPRRHVMPLWQELPLLLVVCFCMAVLVRTFLLQAFYIPSSSMEATLLIGDRVVVNKIVYDVRTPERGEIVVFRGPANWAPENPAPPASGLLGRIGRTLGDLVGVSRPGEKDFIKRVIGLPGDRVSCCDPGGRIYVNGEGIDEPYINVNSALDVPPTPGTCGSRRFAEVLVPPGQLFVMGDNRIVSQDSRCQGPVPIENVIGRAFAIVWPSGRWGSLSSPRSFDSVPDPVALGPPAPVPGRGPAPGEVTVGAVMLLPILASVAVTARTARKRRSGRRRLPW